MRVLFIADNFPPETNAAAARVYERAVMWAGWGHEVTVITCAPNFPEGKVYPGYKNRFKSVETMDGIRVVRVMSYIAPNSGVFYRTLDFLSFMASSFVASLFEKKPDLVTATTPQFFAGLAGLAAAAAIRRPYVLELSDLWPESISAVGAMKKQALLSILEKIELGMYRRSTRIMALSGSFKDNLVRRGVSAGKIDVVINGVDLSKFSPMAADMDLKRQLGLEGRYVVGYIGTHGMAHALDKALDAAKLVQSDPEIRMLFVGAGAAREELLKKAEREKIDNVIFVPRQAKERIRSYWSVCDLALVSLKDTPLFSTVIPSKIFEAMAMGLPILYSGPEGEGSAIVRANGVGECVPPERPELLAEAISGFKRNRAQDSEFRNNCAKSVHAFSRERQARETLEVYRRAMGNGPHAG